MNRSIYYHACPEWDDLYIDETSWCISACTCFNDEEFKRSKQKQIDKIDKFNEENE